MWTTLTSRPMHHQQQSWNICCTSRCQQPSFSWTPEMEKICMLQSMSDKCFRLTKVCQFHKSCGKILDLINITLLHLQQLFNRCFTTLKIHNQWDLSYYTIFLLPDFLVNQNYSNHFVIGNPRTDITTVHVLTYLSLAITWHITVLLF